MTTSNTQKIYPLVLLGGGHSHVLWLTSWQNLTADSRLQGATRIRPLLISEQTTSPYSGMLPGLLMGQYTFDDCHINLIQLCEKSGCDFLARRCTDIQVVDQLQDKKNVYRLVFKPINSDSSTEDDVIYCETLSINIGSQPFVLNEASAKQVLTSDSDAAWKIKPISQFFKRWQTLQQQLKTSADNSTKAKTIRIIGAGAAGVEIACAIKIAHPHCQVQLMSKSATPLPRFNKKVQHYCRKRLKKMNIEFIVSGPTTLTIPAADFSILCTHSAAPSWLKNTPLALSEEGFINVDRQLETSLPGIFAAGDCLHFNAQPLPKAGVFAVRQAPTLFHNVCASLHSPSLPQHSLISYKPQTEFLSIINMGNRYAIGQRGKFSWHGRLLWHYKHMIDQRFMSQFI